MLVAVSGKAAKLEFAYLPDSVLSFMRRDNGITKISKMTRTILETDNNTHNIANVSLFY